MTDKNKKKEPKQERDAGPGGAFEIELNKQQTEYLKNKDLQNII